MARQPDVSSAMIVGVSNFNPLSLGEPNYRCALPLIVMFGICPTRLARPLGGAG